MTVQFLRTLDGPVCGTEPFYLDAATHIFVARFAGLSIQHEADVEEIRQLLLERLHPLGEKVSAIVDYNGFSMLANVTGAFADMVTEVAETHYRRVSWHTQCAGLRARLGNALHLRGVAPHIFGSEQDAWAYLERFRHVCTNQRKSVL